MLKNRAKKKEMLQERDVTDVIDLADNKFKHGKFSEAIHLYDAALKQVTGQLQSASQQRAGTFRSQQIRKSN